MCQLASLSTLIAADDLAIGSGRLIPTTAAAVGLIGTVIGAFALVRAVPLPGPHARRVDGILAGVAGTISLVVGGLHAANSAGGFGTGNGLAGAVAAIVLGLASLFLGGLAMARARRPKSASRSTD